MAIPTFTERGSAMALDEQRKLLSIRLRYARTQLQLTQADFAEQCGISIPTYKRFELGSCDSLAVLLKIMAMFNRTYALDLVFPGEMNAPSRPHTLMATYDQLQKKRKNSSETPDK